MRMTRPGLGFGKKVQLDPEVTDLWVFPALPKIGQQIGHEGEMAVSMCLLLVFACPAECTKCQKKPLGARATCYPDLRKVPIQMDNSSGKIGTITALED